MINIQDKTLCCGCYACYNICPASAINMVEDSECFNYPIIDIDKCNNCGSCEKVCPSLNAKNKQTFETITYACINNDNQIRLDSSSGGIFSLLAEYVISNDGVVFGACFNDELKLVHHNADNYNDYKKFRGSKYLQSIIGNTYKQAKNVLDNNKLVLFSGTPCQINGLKLYLKQDYSNLILIDLICHGVPCLKVFDYYKNELESYYKAKVKSINFRRKYKGWSNFSISFIFDNNKEYSQVFSKDLFIKGFLKNLYLRPSCYNCKYTNLNRFADITLGDYWGVKTIYPDLDDDKGTSLILINSSKGEMYFNLIADKISYRKANLNHAIAYNSCIVKGVDPHPNREKFFQLFNNCNNLAELINDCLVLNKCQRFRYILQSLISRVKQLYAKI